jgi:hypothetical protein
MGMSVETTAMSFDVQKYVCPPPFCESNFMKKCSFFFVSVRRYARCCEKMPRGHVPYTRLRRERIRERVRICAEMTEGKSAHNGCTKQHKRKKGKKNSMPYKLLSSAISVSTKAKTFADLILINVSICMYRIKKSCLFFYIYCVL